jgi:hypothetical protein
MSINTSQCRPSVPPEQFESEYERIFGKKPQRADRLPRGVASWSDQPPVVPLSKEAYLQMIVDRFKEAPDAPQAE